MSYTSTCPTCSHNMQCLGCCDGTGANLPFFWCPRCGTIRTCDAVVATPALVYRCRDLAKRGDPVGGMMRILGITESVNPAEASA